MGAQAIDVSVLNLGLARTIEEVHSAVNDVVEAIRESFKTYYQDRRDDERAERTASAGGETAAADDGTAASGTASANPPPIAQQTLIAANNANSKVDSVSNTVNTFIKSVEPSLPGLKTLGLTFATTALGTSFLVSTIISAIKFVFTHPFMFLGALIGGTFLYKMFEAPIKKFINDIIGKVQDFIATTAVKVVAEILKSSDIAKLIGPFLEKLVENESFKKSLDSVMNAVLVKVRETAKGLMDDFFSLTKDILKKDVPASVKEIIGIATDEIPSIVDALFSAVESRMLEEGPIKATLDKFDRGVAAAENISTTLNNVSTQFSPFVASAGSLVKKLDENFETILAALSKMAEFAEKGQKGWNWIKSGYKKILGGSSKKEGGNGDIIRIIDKPDDKDDNDDIKIPVDKNRETAVPTALNASPTAAGIVAASPANTPILTAPPSKPSQTDRGIDGKLDKVLETALSDAAALKKLMDLPQQVDALRTEVRDFKSLFKNVGTDMEKAASRIGDRVKKRINRFMDDFGKRETVV